MVVGGAVVLAVLVVGAVFLSQFLSQGSTA